MEEEEELFALGEDPQKFIKDFKQFLERLEAVRSQEKEALSCLFPTEYLCLLRIKQLREWPSELAIKKINDCLAILRSIKITGVMKLVIGPIKFQEKISRDLRLEFIDNLQNLEGLLDIQVDEFQQNNLNPDLFLLFSLFSPTQLGQTFVYSSYSKGRKFLIETTLSKNGKIEQVLTFNEAFNQKPIIKQLMSLNFQKTREYEKDLTISDLQELNFQLWQIIQNEKISAIDIQKLAQKSLQARRKYVKIHFNLENSHLRQLLECSKDLLKVFNEESNVENLTLKIKESFVFSGIPKEQIENFSFRDIEELPISSKLCLNLSLLTIDYELIAELMRFIKGITIINISSDQIPYKSSLFDNIKKLQSSNNISGNNVWFQNLKILEIININISLEEVRRLFKQLPHLTEVGYRNYQKIKDVFTEESAPCLADLINSYSSLNILDQVILENKTLFLSNAFTQFTMEQLNVCTSMLLKINKPIFLRLSLGQEDSQHSKVNLMRFASQAAFNSLVMHIKINNQITVFSPEYQKIISKIKSFYPLLIAYDQCISPFMTYNPRHIILDLFVCD